MNILVLLSFLVKLHVIFSRSISRPSVVSLVETLEVFSGLSTSPRAEASDIKLFLQATVF